MTKLCVMDMLNAKDLISHKNIWSLSIQQREMDKLCFHYSVHFCCYSESIKKDSVTILSRLTFTIFLIAYTNKATLYNITYIQ